jgi:hypothetical protein
MGKDTPTGSTDAGQVLREDFSQGLKHFHDNDYAGALPYFRAADEGADLGDILQGRYTSFHGLSRVCEGDRSGVKLCRKAAAGEAQDADVLCNLAMAEHRLGNRESAWTALRYGLRIDSDHAGLNHLKETMKLRKQRALLPGLLRNNPVNRLVGRMFRGMRKPFMDD